MQEFALNSGTLNGTSGVPLVAASANVVASASITAVARNNGAMLGDTTAYGSFVAIGHVIAGAGADVSAGATVIARQTLQQAARATLHGTAEANFFVVRMVMAAAYPMGTAEILAFPEGKLANAAILSTSSVTATGQRVQPGRASGSCNAELSASGRVLRMARATVDPSARLRVEAQRNKQVDAFADLVVTGEVGIPNAGIVRRMVAAELENTAEFMPVAQRVQAGRMDATGLASEVIGEPLIYKVATVGPITGTATVAADASRVQAGAASAECSVVLELKPAQRHMVQASALAASNVTSIATRRAHGRATFLGTAELTGSGDRHRMADATFAGGSAITAVANLNIPTVGQVLVGTSSIAADAYVTRFVAASIGASASALAVGERYRMADAQASTGAELVANALRTANTATWLDMTADIQAAPFVTRYAASAARGESEVYAYADAYSVLRYADSLVEGTATLLARASNRAAASALIAGSSLVTANAFTNMAAMDPPERTMVRQFVDREMSRPFTDREMRRAA